MAQKVRFTIIIEYEPVPADYKMYEDEIGNKPTIYEMAAHDKILINSNELLVGDFDNANIEWEIIDG